MDCSKLSFKLISGDFMPLIGFGTYQITGGKLIRDVLDHAFASGYRSIDTAAVYNNEEDIGSALKELLPKHNLQRQDIFITSKLPPSHHGEKAVSALKSSLRKLDCGYLDLYLIHWPGQQGTTTNNPNNAQVRSKTWEQLVRAQKEGLARNIGVSNYTVQHLGEVLSNSFGVKPAVNQVEWHPHYHQSELRELCRREGILLQAYSSLGGSNNPNLISDSTVGAIAKKLGKQPAQILLRWAIQQEIAIIPKARSQKHISSNIALNFDIPEEDMAALDNLQQHKYAWDPTIIR